MCIRFKVSLIQFLKIYKKKKVSNLKSLAQNQKHYFFLRNETYKKTCHQRLGLIVDV